MEFESVKDLIKHIELMWQNGEIEDSFNGNRLEMLAYAARKELQMNEAKKLLAYYGYVLKIASLDGAYEFEVSFFLDKLQARRWQASGTCPSIEACFNEAQIYKESVLRDNA